jgi:hypothetical protein
MLVVFSEFRNTHAIALPDGRGKCTLCEKVFKCFRYTKMHIEIKHQPQTKIMCTFCNKFSKNVYAFRNHVQLMHNITGVQNVVETYGKRVAENFVMPAVTAPLPSLPTAKGEDE